MHTSSARGRRLITVSPPLHEPRDGSYVTDSASDRSVSRREGDTARVY